MKKEISKIELIKERIKDILQILTKLTNEVNLINELEFLIQDLQDEVKLNSKDEVKKICKRKKRT